MKGRTCEKNKKLLLIIVIIISSLDLSDEYFIKEPPVEESQVEVNDKYTVRWENYDGTLLEMTNNLSRMIKYLGKTPEKNQLKI